MSNDQSFIGDKQNSQDDENTQLEQVRTNLEKLKKGIFEERLKELYNCLGLTTTAKTHDIKKAFRALSLTLHPDKYTAKTPQEQKDATNKFSSITEAHNVLTNTSAKLKHFNDLLESIKLDEARKQYEEQQRKAELEQRRQQRAQHVRNSPIPTTASGNNKQDLERERDRQRQLEKERLKQQERLELRRSQERAKHEAPTPNEVERIEREQERAKREVLEAERRQQEAQAQQEAIKKLLEKAEKDAELKRKLEEQERSTKEQLMRDIFQTQIEHYTPPLSPSSKQKSPQELLEKVSSAIGNAQKCYDEKDFTMATIIFKVEVERLLKLKDNSSLMQSTTFSSLIDKAADAYFHAKKYDDIIVLYEKEAKWLKEFTENIEIVKKGSGQSVIGTGDRELHTMLGDIANFYYWVGMAYLHLNKPEESVEFFANAENIFKQRYNSGAADKKRTQKYANAKIKIEAAKKELEALSAARGQGLQILNPEQKLKH